MRTAVARRNEMLDIIIDNFVNGYFRIYSGTRPATADTALSGNLLLAELRFHATVPFTGGAASGGVLTAAAITSDSSADASGTASFVRCFASDGITALCDLSIGTSGTEVIVSTTTITATVAVSVSSMTITFPVGT